MNTYNIVSENNLLGVTGTKHSPHSLEAIEGLCLKPTQYIAILWRWQADIQGNQDNRAPSWNIQYIPRNIHPICSLL